MSWIDDFDALGADDRAFPVARARVIELRTGPGLAQSGPGRAPVALKKV